MSDSLALSIDHELLLEGLITQAPPPAFAKESLSVIDLLEPDIARLVAPYLHQEGIKNLVIKTNNLRFIHSQCQQRGISTLINLKRINFNRYMNKFLEGINQTLPEGAVFIGRAETYNLRRQRLFEKFPWGIRHLVYVFDTLHHRVIPKLPLLKKVYFRLTGGKYRMLSRTEVLGRLYSCGFEVVAERNLDHDFFFVAKKRKEPCYHPSATYGPLIHLKRRGKNGKLFHVYKFRTMYPYSEYLQDYVYRQNRLDLSGKMKDDFRITPYGRFMRKLWLDELPMIVNFLKGEMKLVGVRPLSRQYFDLYSEELKARRIRTKPGLVPPYYAQYPTPTGLDEIMKNEMDYLEAHEKAPLATDWKYFWRAFRNIVFRNARSK